MNALKRIGVFLTLIATASLGSGAYAAGSLTPTQAGLQPAEIVDHDVVVVINNGFARTEVTQTFFNPNNVDMEAIYSFPVPASASLSEMTILTGEREMHGEVLTRAQADRIYDEEKAKGNDAGKAEKNGFQTFDFYVSPVKAQGETQMRFVYYQPVPLDATVGRYVYPLQGGGTDDAAAAAFWTGDDTVRGTFSFEVELKSAVPVEQVRMPGYENAVLIDKLDEGHYRARLDQQQARLNRDIVVYYRLPNDMPGQVELLTYKPDAGASGTFMMVVTPGIDLAPLSSGADYVFVLDVSGSMAGELQSLLDGVAQGLGRLNPQDRFRVVLFSDRADEVTRGWEAVTAENVDECIRGIARRGAGGSTNLYAGMDLALKGLDDDRATSLVLVTDAVTNTGVVDPAEFRKLAEQYDIRVFGFLLGNNGNWPLIRMVCEASGGFWQRVSNADDIYGQVVLAQGKITHECLHGAEMTIDGVDAFETTDLQLGKVYRGQQLILFGKYRQGGPAKVALHATLTGVDQTYETTFDFPEVSDEHPEIERLWALDWIESLETQALTGLIPADEAGSAIAKLGVRYQLVTDETSMVVLPDEVFESYGIDRQNRDRVAREHVAQQQQRLPVQQGAPQRADGDAQVPPQPASRDHRVDRARPMFNSRVPSPGGSSGGGAISPLGLGLLLIPAALGLRRRSQSA